MKRARKKVRIEMPKNLTKRDKIIFLCLGIIFISALLLQSIKRSLPQDYSVAVVTRIDRNLKTGLEATFEYKVNNREFEGYLSIQNFPKEPEIGDSYIVEFPENFKGYFGRLRPYYGVVKNNVHSPSVGWDRVPSGIFRNE